VELQPSCSGDGGKCRLLSLIVDFVESLRGLMMDYYALISRGYYGKSNETMLLTHLTKHIT